MAISIKNPPDPPQIDSALPLLTHATDDLAISSASARSSNSNITKIKNVEFLHDTNNDRSQRFPKIMLNIIMDSPRKAYKK